MMGSDFIDDSRQDEKVNIEKLDRHGGEPYNLADNGVKFYIIPYYEEEDLEGFEAKLHALRPEIGRY